MPSNSRIHRMFQGFADPTRLRILHLLTRGELCVCDVMSALKLPQPKISRHLAYLKASGLVQDRRAGLWKYYSLAKAEGKFHKKLIQCLASCFNEVDELRRDRARLKSQKTSKRC